MPQSSPSHVRAPRVARSRAKVALILASVCALVTAVLVPLTSHLHAQAASNVPVTIPSLEGWTPASGAWTPASGLQIVRPDSAEAAGVSALLSRALTDAGITGITEGTAKDDRIGDGNMLGRRVYITGAIGANVVIEVEELRHSTSPAGQLTKEAYNVMRG